MKRNQAHRKWKQIGNSASLPSFHYHRNKFELAYKNAKKNVFFADKFRSCISDAKQTYKLLNEISGRSMQSKVPILRSCYEATATPSNEDVAEKFNSFFINAPNEVRSTIPDIECPDFAINNKSMYLYKVRDVEIFEIVNKLENKTSSGIDGINNILVKSSATVVVRFLKHLINISIARGIFPEILKYAKVLPLHKGGSKIEENNYRPISLLVIWSKIYERAM